MEQHLSMFKEWSLKCQSDSAMQNDLCHLTALGREVNEGEPWLKEIADRFYKELDFGTGGMRGIMGLGTNRMNCYIVRKATRALADFLLCAYGAEGASRGVVIAYDSRNHSRFFAKEAALTLAAAEIPTKVFSEATPTPVLSFAVRRLGCIAGIVITASHNPKEYNGYKIYDPSGCQLTPENTLEITRHMQQIENVFEVAVAKEFHARAKGLLCDLNGDVLKAFTDELLLQAHPLSSAAKAALRIVYSPLHGTGGIPVAGALFRLNYHTEVVREQALPDGGFPTVYSPNPEDPAALKRGILLARQSAADLVIATDPDCDRVGAAVKHGGAYLLLTGNQIGALLVNYVLLRRKDALGPDAAIVKTIVTNDLGAQIARKHGLHVEETLTGFKYIGEMISRWERDGSYQFLAGYEESNGYLVGAHARDKDAVVASVLICEMAAYYKEQGKTLADVLEDLYDEYGFYLDGLDSFSFTGIEGEARISKLMADLRNMGMGFMEGVTQMVDYLCAVDSLPEADVLKYRFADGSWLAVRPSGTEPKIKLYYSVRQAGNDKMRAYERLSGWRARVQAFISA